MICNKCEVDKNYSDFSWAKKDVKRRTTCKSCDSVSTRNHYNLNKGKYTKSRVDNNKKYLKRNQEWIYNYLSLNSCVNCGEKEPLFLEFDHIGKKHLDVSRMISSSYSLETIKTEIKECQILCIYCHRLKTAKDRGYYRYLKSNDLKKPSHYQSNVKTFEWIYDYLCKNPCVDCGESKPLFLEFDHLIDKSKSISQMVDRKFSLDSIKLEIKKCEIRCLKCHRFRTNQTFSSFKYKKYLMKQGGVEPA